MDLTGARWRKSTRSNQNNTCVEVADNLPEVVLVRDSKDRAAGMLAFTPEAWRVFVADVAACRP